MADALLLVIPDIPDNLGILTGKLFEYLASQKPILAIGPNGGEALEIVEECAAGKGFYYDDAMGMKDYLINLIQRKSAGLLLPNPSNAYQRFSRVAQAEQIAALLVPSTTS
jgi:glycosyltransferase involved in cell wall biosynthesis